MHFVGWRGGVGVRGRRKYVHVGLAAACSCALSCAHGKTRVGHPAQPARGMPRAHAADTPHSDTAPPSTVPRRCRWGPTVGRHICQISNEFIHAWRGSTGNCGYRYVWLLVGVDLGRHDFSVRYRISSGVRARYASTGSDPVPYRQIAGNCRRRGGSGCGGVSRMDAATELTWTYLQRPPQPDPPRHPTECPLLLLLFRLSASGRHYSRCRAASPAGQHPSYERLT